MLPGFRLGPAAPPPFLRTRPLPHPLSHPLPHPGVDALRPHTKGEVGFHPQGAARDLRTGGRVDSGGQASTVVQTGGCGVFI